MKKQKMRFISAVLAACMMTSVLPVNALALGGGTPENGVTAQENTAATTIPFEGTTITKGGNYEIPEGTYTGGITIDTEDDTTDEVTIRITGDVTFTQPNKIFIDVEHVKLVTIENDGHTVKLNGHHFMDFFHSGSAVVNGGTYIAPGRNMIMLRGSGNSLTLNNVNMQTNTGYAVTTENTGHTVVVNGGTFTKSSSANSEFMNYGHLTLTDVTVIPEADGDGKTSTIVENYPGAVLEINGGSYKTINQNCIVNSGMARINDGTFASEGASCINNKWGRVEINDGTTITYVKDNIDLNAVPTEAGSYTFKISVKANAALNYTATEQPLTDISWTFQIHTASYGVSVTGGQFYILKADGTKQYPSSELGVPAGTKVYLELNNDYAEDPDFEFRGWQLAENSTKLDGDHDLTLKDDSYFTMPHGDVKLSLITDSGDQGGDTDTTISSGDDAGAGVAIVLGGAAIGGVAYLAGTQLYLESVLPKGAAIPVNRQQLADLLWTTAGKPQPQNSVLFTDISAEAIDSQKAARWCVEQGLMQADGASFKPSRHTFRLQVIKAWNDLQAMPKAG